MNNTPIKKENEGFNIISFLLFCLKNRLLIIIPLSMIIIIALTVAIFLYASSPRVTTSYLTFDLNFDGLNQHKYPNENKFEDEDIISTPILMKTYQDNNLTVLFGSFDNFKKTISIMKQNAALAMLNMNYKAKLSQTTLTDIKRAELENEYYAKKEESLKKSNNYLICSYQSRMYKIPQEIINKILREILKNWLEIARKEEGNFEYNLSVYNTKLLDGYVKGEDYFKSLDLLRNVINTIAFNCDELEKLPNLYSTKVEINNRVYKYKDIKLGLNLLKNEIEEEIGIIIKYGIIKDKVLTENYLKTKINILKNSLQVVITEKKLTDNMQIQSYLTPSASYINLGIKEVRLKQDLEYYQKALVELSANIEQPSANMIKKVKEKQIRLNKDVMNIISAEEKFMEKLSKRNLNSYSEYYKIISFTSKSFLVGNKLILIAAVFCTIVFSIVLIIAGFLIKFVYNVYMKN
jgi:hypothetical protein